MAEETTSSAALENIYESTQLDWHGAVAGRKRGTQQVTQMAAPDYEGEPCKREKYFDGANAGVAFSRRK